MRYLVTGGAGFIGSKVATYLIARGHTVIVVDNLCTGARDRVPPEAEFVHADLSRDYWKSDVGRIDGIFHLAAMSKVAPSLRDSSMMRFCAEANIIATMNVLNFAACQTRSRRSSTARLQQCMARTQSHRERTCAQTCRRHMRSQNTLANCRARCTHGCTESQLCGFVTLWYLARASLPLARTQLCRAYLSVERRRVAHF